MFVSFRGSTSLFPYAEDQGCVILSHPSIVDALVLSQFQSDPYQRSLEGFAKSDGRSLTGSLIVKGGSYTPVSEWQFNLLVKSPQLLLFESLLNVQRQGPITLQDRFTRFDTSTVWLDVDNQYVTQGGSLSLYKLQFRARKQ